MPAAVVAGGSVAGLATALALSGIGYDVQVLERAAPPPEGPLDAAADGWRRPTVPQSGHSHTLTSLGVRVLRERAPRVLAAAAAAGAHTLDLTAALPGDATDGAREPGDEELVALGVRRAVLELVLYRAVRELPGVTVRHGTAVGGLELDPAGRRVLAVVTTDGERVPADVVVDATGRQTLSRTWLRIAGVPVAEDRSSPSGLSGCTRFYLLNGAGRPGPLGRGNAAGGIWDHYAGVLHPGDGGTFSIALATLPGDRATAELRRPAGFTAVARATPGLTDWLAEGVAEPISPVHAITSPPNLLRGVATTGQRPVAGLFPVGDAACVTNPLFGRGLSLALDHAFRLADVLAARPEVDIAQRRAVARMTEELFLPWYEQSVASDRARIAHWRAAVNGASPPPAPPAADGMPTFEEVSFAARHDGLVWRGLTRMLMTLATPGQVLGDDKFTARVRQATGAGAGRPRPQHGAPGRADLLRLLTEARRAAV
ncbi:FAD-dependent oxidoreductase [Streptomyces lincolnensis]|uniref:FAD-dependent oxidoreductase n=1 Tax=Streptomyces lincolnensis TaxID=1915 RepID=UPI0037D646EB